MRNSIKPYIGPAIILVFAIALFGWSFTIRNLHFDVLGPRFLPQLSLATIGLLCVLELVLARIKASREGVAEPSPEVVARRRRQLKTSAVTSLLLLIYVAALAVLSLPFELCTPVFITVLAYLLGMRGKAKLAATLVFGVAFACLVGWGFRDVLFVNLP